MLFKMILNYAPYLDDSFVSAIHEWHNVKYGPRARQQRWKVLLLSLYMY